MFIWRMIAQNVIKTRLSLLCNNTEVEYSVVKIPEKVISVETVFTYFEHSNVGFLDTSEKQEKEHEI